jgi:hypothetical protein
MLNLWLEFGLDQAALAELLGDDEKSQKQAEKVLKAFDRGAGMINALEFLIAVIVVCEAKREEKAGLIFDCFDFSNKKNISYDELTILILCFTRALGITAGLEGESNEDLIENITQKRFKKTDKIEKTEYFKLVQEDLGLFDMNKMTNETLLCFGVNQPVVVVAKDEGEGDKLFTDPLANELEQKLNINIDDETKEDVVKAESSNEVQKVTRLKEEGGEKNTINNENTVAPSTIKNTNASIIPAETEKVDENSSNDLPKQNVIVDGNGATVVIGEV